MTDAKRDPRHQLQEGVPPKRPEAPAPKPPTMKVEETYVLCTICNGATNVETNEPCMVCRGTGRTFSSIVYRYETPVPHAKGGQ